MAKRGRKKKHEHDFLGIFIKIKCPVVETEVIIELSVHDITSCDSPCELCGSHGDITVDYTCPACGESHSYELKSW